jgi:4-diphosphocytidyl-2C-methyl-D-erythritol kinase
MAFAWERGRRLMPLSAPESRPVLILVPDFPIGAAEAYGWLAEDRAAGVVQRPPPSILPGPDSLRDWDVLREIALNDLAVSVFARRPALRELRDWLAGAGAELAMLCGSGSCVAGVFGDEASRDRAAEGLARRSDVGCIRTRTLGSPDPDPG